MTAKRETVVQSRLVDGRGGARRWELELECGHRVRRYIPHPHVAMFLPLERSLAPTATVCEVCALIHGGL